MFDLLDDDRDFFRTASAFKDYLDTLAILDQHFVWRLEGVKYNEYAEDEPLIVFRWTGSSICCGYETEYSIITEDDFFDGRFEKTRQLTTGYSARFKPELKKIVEWF